MKLKFVIGVQKAEKRWKKSEVKAFSSNTRRPSQLGVASYSEEFLGNSEKKHVLQAAGEKSIQESVWKKHTFFFLTKLSKQGQQ